MRIKPLFFDYYFAVIGIFLFIAFQYFLGSNFSKPEPSKFNFSMIEEWRKWSLDQTPYYYYRYNNSYRICASPVGVIGEYQLRKSLEESLKDTLWFENWLNKQNTKNEINSNKMDYNTFSCNPNTPYFIVGSTPDSLWVEVITFGYRIHPGRSDGRFMWGYAFKPLLKTMSPEKGKDCTSKSEIPSHGNWGQ